MSKAPEGVLPDDYQKIKEAARATGTRKSALRTDVIEHYKRGDFTVDTVGSYLLAQKETRPHWFKGNDGGDGLPKGQRETNPWGPGAQWNVTRQGQLVKSLGIEKASKIAAAAGSHIGATRPAQ